MLQGSNQAEESDKTHHCVHTLANVQLCSVHNIPMHNTLCLLPGCCQPSTANFATFFLWEGMCSVMKMSITVNLLHSFDFKTVAVYVLLCYHVILCSVT